jgi:uncharacterized membrane protein
MKPLIDKKRHILKTITWRIVGTLDTIIIGWVISGDPTIGLSIGGLEVFTKMILYYLHERAWYRSRFGIHKKKTLSLFYG